MQRRKGREDEGGKGGEKEEEEEGAAERGGETRVWRKRGCGGGRKASLGGEKDRGNHAALCRTSALLF